MLKPDLYELIQLNKLRFEKYIIDDILFKHNLNVLKSDRPRPLIFKYIFGKRMEIALSACKEEFLIREGKIYNEIQFDHKYEW